MKTTSLIAIVSVFSAVTNGVWSQCNGPLPNLGNDTSVCVGSSIVLNPGNSGQYSSYLWDNNSTNPTRAVNQAGTYWVTVGYGSGNIITNGDFEQGNTGFTTDYAVGTGGSFGQLSLEGTYAVSSSPSLVHNNFNNCQDHTPNPGNQMMIVNGSGNPNTNVWCQTVPVNQNTSYSFSTWASSALNDVNVAQLQFSINGSVIGSIFSPSTQGCTWNQFFQTWNSGIQTSAQICIVNQNTGVSGNDFMIDDISFTPLCFESDTIVVTAIQPPVITVTPNDTICTGDLSNIVASSTNPNLTYTWNPGGIQSPTLAVSPANSTSYNVTGVDENGCVSNLVSRFVVVRPKPTVDIGADKDTLCLGASVFMLGYASDLSVTYQWTPNLSSISSLTDTPSATTEYSVIVENSWGCQGFDTIEIVVIPQLNVTITGDLEVCDGEGTTLFATGNYPDINYAWTNGSTAAQLNFVPSNGEIITLSGSYLDCPIANDQVTMIVNEIPVAFGPSDFLICAGESIQAQASASVPGSQITWLPSNQTGNSIDLTVANSEFIYLFASNNGCVSELDTFFVEVLHGCDIEVPNVFSPNSDGINDVFSLISFEGIETLDCTILNRWGNVIATYTAPNFYWDGKNTEAGVYFYVIHATTASGTEIEKEGFVQLIR